jgi:hypothetical protein
MRVRPSTTNQPWLPNLEVVILELALEFPLIPPLTDGKPHIEFAFFRALALPQDDEVMRPGNCLTSGETIGS